MREHEFRADVIAGFGYEINALDEENENELAEAFSTMQVMLGQRSYLRLLQIFLPVLKIIVSQMQCCVCSTFYSLTTYVA